LNDAAAVIVLVRDAMTKQMINSLVKCLGNVECVNLMRLSHNRSGLDVSFRHDGSNTSGGAKKLCYGALDSRDGGVRALHEHWEEVCEPRVTI
jgi:hypothetical protein